MRVVSLLLSIVALAISVLAFFSKCCYGGIPNGVLSLISICCTLIVGLSVADAIAVRRLERKVHEIDKLQIKVDRMLKQSNILFHYTWGFQQKDLEPVSALNEFWEGFCIAAKTDDIKRGKSCLDAAETIVNDILSEKYSVNDLNYNNLSRKPWQITDEVKKTNLYCAFEDKVNTLMEKIDSMTKTTMR